MADYSLKAVFGVDTVGLQSGIKEARSAVNDLVNEWGKWAALAGVAAFTSLARGAIELGSHLSDTAQNIGINVISLQALEAQAARNGVSEEQFTKALEKTKASVIQAADGNKIYEAALTRLGLTSAMLLRLPLDQQYEAIAKAATKAKDQNEAYSAVVALLGEKVGPKLMASLKDLADVGLPGVVKSATAAGQVMSVETIAALDKAGDAIDDFKKRATVAVGDIIVNFRSEDGLKLLGLQLLKVAGEFGGMILDGFNAAWLYFKSASGAAGVYLRERLQNAFVDSVEALAEALNKVLPKKMEINIGNLESLRAASEDFGDILAREISTTSPTTFKKDFGDMWQGAIDKQRTIVDALNKVDFKDGIKGLKDAMKPPPIPPLKPPDPPIPPVEVNVAPLKEVLNAFSNLSSTFEGSADYTAMSSDALNGLKDRLTAQLNSLGSNGLTLLKNADMNTNYGDWTTAQALKARLGGMDGLGGITGELSLRQSVVAYDKQFGDAATTQKFGDAVTQRSLQGFVTEQQKTNTVLDQILKKFG